MYKWPLMYNCRRVLNKKDRLQKEVKEMDMNDWLEDSNNENKELKLVAIEMLGLTGDVNVIEPLAGHLRTGDEEVRASAAEALGMLNDPRAAAFLAGALEDCCPDVRKCAACALGKIKDPGSAPALEKALKDPDFNVRWRAAEALTSMGIKTFK
ncbi:hypothetical protein MCP_2391 [Methanocella paludicola SANAE]|uniref:HEAT repeat domain-containing protein n=2 Tax=Methanocella TaxID=570266 RepID=D1Z191_METPS|nr:hypothetical protein MCP_2391 [Methanocella paludicola SANAE]